mgnify:CR=1 FL=1
MRVGMGFDAHPLGDNRRLMLGGVEIPFHSGLLGHSDGDALVHSIMDSLLGGTGLGDKGSYFPSSNHCISGIPSLELLTKVEAIVSQDGWRIVNLDATILAQDPQLSPYLQQMKTNIAATLSIAETCVSVKATTTDHLGFMGRGEGIAACTVALLETK